MCFAVLKDVETKELHKTQQFMRILLLIVCFALSVTAASAQEKETIPTSETERLNPNALATKLIFIDYSTMNPELGESKISNGLEITYLRNLNQWVNIAVPAKLGLTTFPGELNKTTLASLDAVLQLQYYNGKNKLVPYIFGGGGIVSENFSSSNLQFPVGAGLNFELGKNSYVNVQAEMRTSTAPERKNMQYGVGYMFRLGNTAVKEKQQETQEKIEEISDRDGDGVADKQDECPDAFGDKNFFGCPDTDADGVPDPSDACPNAAGTLATLGCPDADGDGISDADDDCPEAAGTVKTLGCPDTDGDGLSDNMDDCPDLAGKKRFNGCPEAKEEPAPEPAEIDFAADDLTDNQVPKIKDTPEHPVLSAPKPIQSQVLPDTDKDGVIDAEDRCPDEPGSKNSQGCPDSDGDGFTDDVDECPLTRGLFQGCPDTDKDGVNDANDNCPEVAGTKAAGGCPPMTEVADEDLAILSTATREVRFETGSDILTADSYAVLERVRDAMLRYPNFRLMIEGHTDNVGDDRKNQLLSENRAKACYNYLIANGVQPLNVQYIGYGEMRPLGDNKSKRGRELNRRVEFRMEMK